MSSISLEQPRDMTHRSIWSDCDKHFYSTVDFGLDSVSRLNRGEDILAVRDRNTWITDPDLIPIYKIPLPDNTFLEVADPGDIWKGAR